MEKMSPCEGNGTRANKAKSWEEEKGWFENVVQGLALT